MEWTPLSRVHILLRATVGWEMGDVWLDLSDTEFDARLAGAKAALDGASAGNAQVLAYLRHTLLSQLGTLRRWISMDLLDGAQATEIMRGDFGSGYLFGFARHYAETCGVNRFVAGREPIGELYALVFGPEQAARLVAEHAWRQADGGSLHFEQGLLAATDDLNPFGGRTVFGVELEDSTGLREGLEVCASSEDEIREYLVDHTYANLFPSRPPLRMAACRRGDKRSLAHHEC